MSAHQSPVLYAVSTPLSSEAGSMSPHQVDSGEPDISRIHLGEDGDVEMVQAEAPSVNVPTVNSAAVSAKKVPRKPADSNMIVWTPPKDDANGQQHLLKVRAKVEDLNCTISTLKHSIKLFGERVAVSIDGGSAGSSDAASGGMAISKRDLPKFQLKSDSYDIWLKEELLKVNTWKEAKDAFVKKFNSSFHGLSVRRAVHSPTMQVGETTEQYMNRLSASCIEAGYDSNDTTSIGDAFLNGFPPDWQIQVTSLLCNFYPGRQSWTTSEIAGAAGNILGGNKCPLFTIVDRAAGAGASTSNGGKTKGGYHKECSAGGQQGHCRHSESTFSRGKEEGKRNVSAFATQTPIYCVHCGKRWFPDQSCPEYYSAVKANGGQKPKGSKGKGKSNDHDEEETNRLRQAYENQSDCIIKPSI
ncbi:hypothetical protein FB192DRAFT_1447103 [Mucor lusitanicus]|uniref:Retrotransposon gag domain-containing protein n=1 Tax=Mucor circinelloides f. lusitanicus TaxID=29924 RepID=A0A8H4F185_MUCCL|nr:hypothetical protein FB192DRAFT_1447103 [Mucor lusitanicus]